MPKHIGLCTGPRMPMPHKSEQSAGCWFWSWLGSRWFNWILYWSYRFDWMMQERFALMGKSSSCFGLGSPLLSVLKQLGKHAAQRGDVSQCYWYCPSALSWLKPTPRVATAWQPTSTIVTWQSNSATRPAVFGAIRAQVALQPLRFLQARVACPPISAIV